MSRRVCAAALLCCCAAAAAAQQPTARTPGRFVTRAAAAPAGSFPLASNGAVAPIFASPEDDAGVLRAARDLQADLDRVTGTRPSFATGAPAGRAIIIGTLGHSAIVDRLAREHRIDVTGVAGKWEASLTQVVQRPLPNVPEALVIAGSDRRGTIFAIYELSSQIGVSPWYWWADVPVRRATGLRVAPGRHVLGEPAVKYRGIFINDEAPAFSGWAREKFGGLNHEMYARMFELILRLRGNFLWPAMWGNAFADDDSLNAKLATEYGIVVSTSHHEPMTRAQQEWRRHGSGPWNYEENDSTLRAFWRGGMERMVRWKSEHVVTIGMRGDGDMPMTEGSNIALLERIVADQRRLIADVTGKPPQATPQVWALYKEVQDYYDKGMRVPDDVTLLFSDDNWGNVRRLPDPAARLRTGGYGVYYHFDYVGGPRNYKWLNTNQVARIREQMNLSYRMGADRLWVVNVGDLKPMEFPISFFLDFAWDPDAIPAAGLRDYTRAWARQQFGDANAGGIADLIETYARFAARRKPELLTPETFSFANYREAETVLADYAALAARAKRLAASLEPAYHDAFYQLVLHPILASANLYELYVTVGRNRLAAIQGRNTTNALADSVERLFARDAEISAFYNDTLAGGKWRHIMDQTHIGYTYWQEPPRNVMPRVDRIQVPEQGELGVAWEGQVPFMPPWSGSVVPGTRAAGDLVPASGGGAVGITRPVAEQFPRGAPTLPVFDSQNRQTFWIDLFNRGERPVPFTVTTGAPWLQVSRAAGVLATDERIVVRVAWESAPEGRHDVPITISSTGPNARRFVLRAPVLRAAPPPGFEGFVEGDGHVSMEAEHFTSAHASVGTSWTRVPGLGRTLSGMQPGPVTAPPLAPDASGAWLEYRMFLFDTGQARVQAYFSPTLNFRGAPEGLRYAVAMDAEPPQLMNMAADVSDSVWNRSVADNVRLLTTQHRIAAPGEHVLRFFAVDPGVVLQKIVVDLGGERPSYLGPPESFRSGAADAQFDWFEYAGHDSVYDVFSRHRDTYVNPIIAGFHPDPSIARAGEDYYLVNSSFAYFPGVPIFHSRDLVSWTQIGHVLDRPSQLPLQDGAGISRGIFAPSLSYHDGLFYLITTHVDRGNFYVTATDPRGPWSDPVPLPEVDGIDPSFFFDLDGKAYVVNNGPPIGTPLYDGHRAIWMQEFDAVRGRTTGTRRLIVNGGVDISKRPIWIEGPHVFRKDGRYYLICAEGGTADQHSEVVFRSDSVWGPYVPYELNPILTQRHLDPRRPFPVTSAGHADLVETPDGDWWAVFLGVRPYRDDFHNIGRETFMLPVHWQDGWPHILDGRATVPYVLERPRLAGQPAPAVPTSGNFTIRDEFDGAALPPYWNVIRTPRDAWWALRDGRLEVRARSVALSDRGQPSFVGRRQQHLSATVTTALRYTPVREGDEAGLAAFQSDDFFYLLAVTLVDGQRRIVLRKRAGALTNGQTVTIASAPLPSGEGPVFLRVVARGERYDFLHGATPERLTPLALNIDGTILSTRVAGGFSSAFVGTMLGLYAFTPPHR